ncbi:MAG TPA: Rrf2 family transcriptional regulator [Pyrinomonadaceae bacterium]|jgi:Rrf2 family protein|nr:Rrf2 family transcriptional regulator [Pyrinomonadaceae bacterium]
MAANSQFSMAVHILTMLAKSPGENVKSECLAGSVNTNAVVIRRILSQLGHAKLVTSQTGAFGGTQLAKDPSEIRLEDIYKAVSCGEVFALHPKGANQDCPVGRNVEAVLCNLQKEIDRTVGEKLSQYTLNDILNMIGQQAGA